MTAKNEGSNTIPEAISALETHIGEYRDTLNKEGVWLFLVTLGCWGVTEPVFQLVSLILSVLLFARRMSERISDKRSFSKMIKSLEERITTEVPRGIEQKAHLYDLLQVQKRALSSIPGFREAWPFALCWFFLGATLTYFLRLLLLRLLA